MRRFFAEPLPPAGGRLGLDPATSRHLLLVVRIAPREAVLLYDGRGSEQIARLVGSEGEIAVLEAEGEPRKAAPPHALHLLLALLKGPSMDEAIRMATEAGATHIRPVLAKRSVAKGDKPERWERIAASAIQQCGRADAVTIGEVLGLEAALGALPDDLDRRIALPGADRLPPAAGPAAILVGPEGGWTEGEAQTALRGGCRPTGLGRWVLRAETAAAVAVAMTGE